MAGTAGLIGGTMRRLPVYAIGGLAGALAARIGIPLPWMLGPFFIFAILSASGLSFPLMPFGREMAQIAVGLAIGLRFTAASLVSLSLLLPQMVAATVYLICVTTLAAVLFRRLAGVDPITAFFATAAGGVADMAIIAQKFGGVASSVAVVHAMRVSMVVAVTPFIILATTGQFASGRGGASDAAASPALPLIAALAMAAFVAWALRPTPVPNPWLVGPILAGMTLGIAGLGGFAVPGWLITVAQVLLGVWLGCQFRRNLLTALPRVTAAALVIAGFLVLAALLGAVVLSSLSPLPFTTAFLALAPAAVTEMVLVAKVMSLDAETVAAFHVMRILIVSSSILLIFRLYNRMRSARRGS